MVDITSYVALNGKRVAESEDCFTKAARVDLSTINEEKFKFNGRVLVFKGNQDVYARKCVGEPEKHEKVKASIDFTAVLGMLKIGKDKISFNKETARYSFYMHRSITLDKIICTRAMEIYSPELNKTYRVVDVVR